MRTELNKEVDLAMAELGRLCLCKHVFDVYGSPSCTWIYCKTKTKKNYVNPQRNPTSLTSSFTMAAHEYLHHQHAFTYQAKPIEYQL